MKFFDLLSLCLNNLFRHKLRTSLTLLGVVLGAISVSITIAMGNAIKNNNQKIIDTKGNLKEIKVSVDENKNKTKKASEKIFLDDITLEKLRKIDGVDGIFGTLNINNIIKDYNLGIYGLKNNKFEYDNYILGVIMEDIGKFGYELLDGSLPIQSKLDNQKEIEVIVGQYFEYAFYNTFASTNIPWSKKSRNMNSPAQKYYAEKNNYKYTYKPPFIKYGENIIRLAIPLISEDIDDKLIFKDLMTGQADPYDNTSYDMKNKYRYYNLKVTGRLNWDKVKDMDDWQLRYYCENQIFLNIDLAKSLIKEYCRLHHKSTIYSDTSTKTPLFIYDNVKIKVNDIDRVQDVTTEIAKLNLKPKNMIKEVETEQARTKSNQLVLNVLGAITLFIASLSVANTMFTSMYERTKEIGVMKVIGCKIGNIKIIFLLEATILGMIGGLIGMTITYYISNFMNNITSTANIDNLSGIAKLLTTYMQMMKYDEVDVKLDIALVTKSMWIYIILGSMIVTIVSAYIPAKRASQISALNAIKDE